MTTEEATKSAPLPPYPEMILAAIEALDDKNSSNKSAISSYIEGKYGDLPPAHASLLTAHLARMKETGELVFSKNNYSRADAAPPKRGRGRPPKPKDPVADAVAKATSGMPRARGRPPKKAKVAQKAPIGAPAPAPSAASTAGAVAVKRGRGRPPKVRPAAEPAAA